MRLQSEPFGGSVTVAPTSQNTSIATVSGPLTFTTSNWDQSRTVTVTAANDNLDNPNDRRDTTVTHAVSGGDYGSETASDVAVRVNDEDPPPSVSIAGPSPVAEGNTGFADMVFPVTLNTPSGRTVTVSWSVSDAGSTATVNTDYSSTSGTLVFNPGDVRKTAMVRVHGDLIDEPNETVTVGLSSPNNATLGSSSTATGTITDDDDPPTVSIVAARVAENAGPMMFDVRLQRESGFEVTVDWTTSSGGTATPATDYTAASGTLTFAPGTTSQSADVPLIDDPVDEDDETVRVMLTGAVKATLSGTTATGTIEDDDPPPMVSITAPAAVTEGGPALMVFTVTLSLASAKTAQVDWATVAREPVRSFEPQLNVPDHATSGDDYRANGGTLTFSPGETRKTVTVTALDDLLDERREIFDVVLSSPDNLELGQATATGTIRDNEALPSLAMRPTSAIVSENAGTVTLDAVLTPGSGSTGVGRYVVVDWYTVAETAATGVDFLGRSGTLTFAPGVSTQSMVIPLIDDALNEEDETFRVELINAFFSRLTLTVARVTIEDNDEGASTPSFAVADAFAQEGDSGTTSMAFTVVLSPPSPQQATVEWFTTDGTATAPGDYATAGGTLTFAPNETSKTVTVQVAGDTTDEPDETLTVGLRNSSGPAIIDASATGTIVDDDDVSSLSIAAASVVEGNVGQTTMTFGVTLTPASALQATVDWTTADGTATAGTDFDAGSGTLTFEPTETSKTVTVRVAGDTVDEPDETFTVRLRNAINADLGTPTAVGTIVNDDAPPLLTIADASITEGNAGTVAMDFTVRLSRVSSEEVTVRWATIADTATGGDDYGTGGGTLTFAPGALEATTTVQVNGDELNEADETFTVRLSNAAGARISDATAIGTIANDDPEPSLDITDASAPEGNSGTTGMTFTVLLSPVSGQTATVDWQAVAGTATAGSDFTGSGTLTFAPGEVSKTVTVRVVGDTLDEPNETFTVRLSNPVHATLGDADGAGTIVDNDAAPSFGIADALVAEGNSGNTAMEFTVRLSGPSGRQTAVGWQTVADTASAGSDFAPGSGTLTFAPGETAQTLTVQVVGDTLDEPDETFTVRLSSPSNATLGDAEATGTIANDDGGTALLSIADGSAVEGNSGAAIMEFTVTLSPASAQQATVDWTTADGTATAGEDYASASGTLTFAPSETTKTVNVEVVGDTLDEPDETFTVTLSNAAGATIIDGEATGTITDDDDAPSLAIADGLAQEGDSGAAVMEFTVELSPASGQQATVDWATADGTATAGEDYTSASGTLTFAPNEVSKTVTVEVTGDTLDELNETFTVSLSNASGATISHGEATGTIVDDDAAMPSLSVGDVSAPEGDSGATAMTFTVTLSPASSEQATVDWATADDTATAGEDYASAGGTLTFAPHEISKTVTVRVTGDTVDEPDETFTVRLSNPVGATLADGTATGNIVDDDTTSPRGPMVTHVRAAAPDGAYRVGDGIDIVVTFGEAVTVTGTPLLRLATGGAGRTAAYRSGSGSERLVFRYTVQAGDAADDLDYTGTHALTLPLGASIDAVATGDPAVVTLPAPGAPNSLGANSRIVIDAGTLACAAVVSKLNYVAGRTIDPVLLPEGRGGTGRLSYRLSPELPPGLSLDTATRVLSGTPAVSRERTTYIWTVTDEAGAKVAVDFEITVSGSGMPAVSESLPDRVLAGQARMLLGSVTGALGERFASGAARPEGGAALARFLSAMGTASPSGGEPWEGPVARKDLYRALSGRSFTLALQQAGDRAGPRWSLWGAGDVQRFTDGAGGDSHDGELGSVYLGIDAESDRGVLAGVAVSRSRGESDYDFRAMGGAGRLKTTLTGLYPYVRGVVAGGLELWAAGGAGWGEASVTRDRVGGVRDEGDLHLGLAALGMRREVWRVDGMEVSLVGDAGHAGLSVDGDGSLSDLEASARHLRLGVEVMRRVDLEGGGMLEPFGRLSGREDWGDGASGTGMELAAGLRYRGERLDVEARGRWLALHSASELEERGVSARVVWKPETDGTGLTFRLLPRWGRPEGGDVLSHGAMAPPGASPRLETWALESELGYGVAVPRWWGVVTPKVSYGHDPGRAHSLRLGMDYSAGPGTLGGLMLELTAGRVSDRNAGERHEVWFQGRLRF